MVGFEEGNVERPYIMGGMGDVSGKPNQDLTISSPGEHMLSLTDGTGAGMQAFLAGAFSPLFKNFTQFMPNTVPTFNWDKNKYFEGGFELTDRYGMYKVSGSTDGRNVSIASNWGDVKINAFTGISISAPNGDVKISGKNVTIGEDRCPAVDRRDGTGDQEVSRNHYGRHRPVAHQVGR